MGKPLTEWICAGLGAMVTAATFALVALDLPGSGPASETDVPDIRLMIVGIDRKQAGYVVRIEAQNLSRASVSALEIEGLLRRGGETVETSEVIFDHVARGSSQTGGLWFSQDPGKNELIVRPTGYQAP